MSTHTTARLAHLAGLMSAVFIAACGGGTDTPATSPAPAPAPAPAPSPSAGSPSCDTTLFVAGAAVSTPTATQLSAYAGTYSGNEGAFGPNPGDPFVASAAAAFVLDASGSSTYNGTAATLSSACIETTASAGGSTERLVLHFSGAGHFDIDSTAPGSALTGIKPGSSDVVVRATKAAAPAPAPAPAASSPAPAASAPSPAPAPAGAITRYLDFAAAAPSTPRQVAPSGALAWLAGSYHGRSTAGPCSVTIGADGNVSASMNGSNQSAALDGDSGDTWILLPSNSMSFGVNAVSAGQGVILTGYGNRLALVEMAGVLDKCAIAFKSATSLTMALSSTPPLPVKSNGLLASDLPAFLVGSHSGYAVGNIFFPRTTPQACSLQVAADGTVVLSSGSSSYTAQISGGTTSGDTDKSAVDRLSAYAALTGARDWTWRVDAQSPSGANTVEVLIELAHNGERSQVSYASAQVKPTVGGLASQAEVCYFPN